MKFSARWLSVAAMLANQKPAVHVALVFSLLSHTKKKNITAIGYFLLMMDISKEHQCLTALLRGEDVGYVNPN